MSCSLTSNTTLVGAASTYTAQYQPGV